MWNSRSFMSFLVSIRSMASKTQVGFVGLGNMGNPMAKNLMKHGYPVIASDVFPESCKELQELGAQVRTMDIKLGHIWHALNNMMYMLCMIDFILVLFWQYRLSECFFFLTLLALHWAVLALFSDVQRRAYNCISNYKTISSKNLCMILLSLLYYFSLTVYRKLLFEWEFFHIAWIRSTFCF